MLLLLCFVAGCTVPVDDAPPERPEGGPFIALGGDFADFRSWPRWEIPDIGTTSGHDPGEPRFLYVRDPVPTWGDPFPVGAIIVKTLEIGAETEWEVHAMVKRGGDYNVDGALGWEWFDLAIDPEAGPFIAWRGEGSAADPGGYVSVEATGCNGCHAVVASTDYVFTRAVFTPDLETP
jgi:hypothetical protein